MKVIISLLLTISLILNNANYFTGSAEKESRLKRVKFYKEQKLNKEMSEKEKVVFGSEEPLVKVADISQNFSVEHTEEEEYLLAQLIKQEAGEQPREGKIAVANVVVNRIVSDDFKETTVTDTIYARGQFSGAECVKNVVPTEEEIEIARAVLNGEEYMFYQNSQVLFFRNPGEGNTSDWGQYKYYTTIGDHAFYLKT